MLFRHAPVALLCLVLLAIAGCSDSTNPPAGGGSGAGTIDPVTGTFLLKSVEVELPDGLFCTVELVGSGLVLDDDGIHVDLTVALRNNGDHPLAAPITVMVSDFVPSTTWPVNGELPLMEPAVLGPVPGVDGWIYTEQLGEDQVLDPGEVSDGKLWRFVTEDQGSFSFMTRIFAQPPERPVIAGECFVDENRNGMRDLGEGPLVPGHVVIVRPDSGEVVVPVDAVGRYEYPLQESGLHVVGYVPEFNTLVPIAYSTPNPRHVLITTGPDGEPRGFHEAHFGAYTDLPPYAPPVRFTDAPIDSLHFEPWHLVDIGIFEGDFLKFNVGFSGCQPDHVFSLWMTGGIMESYPPQANLVLVHETAEACDAAWQGEYLFDLTPLARFFHGSPGPNVLLLNVHDFNGGVHQLEWQVESVWPAD